MAATITTLRTSADRLRQEAAQKLRQLVLNIENLPNRAAREIVQAIDKQTASERGWTFIMISPDQNAAVVGWIGKNARRPSMTNHLWATMLTAAHRETGEVMLTRDEMAQRVDDLPNAITDALRELESIGALSRRREPVPGMRGAGRLVVYLNSRVATHLGGAARDRAQDGNQPLKIAVPAPKPSTKRTSNSRAALKLTGASRDKAQQSAQPVSVPVLPKTTPRRASGQKLPKVVAK